MRMTKSALSRWMPRGVVLLCTGLLFSGCANTLRRAAVNSLADALASGGTVYSGDDSPLLIREATPFGLKLMETLLAENPDHTRLLLATAQGFTQYAFAFIKQDADEIEDENLDKALALRAEAKKLLLRGRDYALRALEVRYPNFRDLLMSDHKSALQRLEKQDVPDLYWAGAAWAAAISLAKDDADTIAELPVVDAMMTRALALDESFDDGAIHTFFIAFEMARLGDVEANAARARKHYERALALSKGQNAGLHLALAEAVCVPLEDREEFLSLLDKALRVDVDARKDLRLANTIYQHRARWLMERVDRLFL
ncbi:MAG: TRAP transporter TatT component family protein [Verrucomicrobiia bacterium]